MWRSNRQLMLLYWAIGVIGAAAVWIWAGAPLNGRVVAAQNQRVRATGLVYADQQVSQVVEVPRDGITAIQFWLLAHQRDTGSVVLRVATPEQPDISLAEVQLPLSEFPERPPVTFELPHFTAAVTPVLLFTLEGPELDRAHALSVLGGDNTYGRGFALINRQSRLMEDLSFQVLTQDRRGDSFLPLSRVAQGRPGLFGQPSFYATILWLGLWAYGGVLLMVIRWLLHQRTLPSKPLSPYATRRLTDG